MYDVYNKFWLATAKQKKKKNERRRNRIDDAVDNKGNIFVFPISITRRFTSIRIT